LSGNRSLVEGLRQRRLLVDVPQRRQVPDVVRRRLLLPAIVALMTVVLGAIPGQSRAAVGPVCDYGKFCVWVDPNLSGDEVKFKETDHELSNKIANQMDNQASSAWNNTALAAKLYERRDGKGSFLCIPPNTVVSDFNSMSFDNRASSSKVTKKAGCLT
jgi:hypothetical protein